jgi:thiosulfate/3-mercaptopyruvate sulfurtransferase
MESVSHRIEFRPMKIFAAAAAVALLAAGLTHLPLHGAKSPAASSSEPWTSSQTVQPADLMKELAATNPAEKPIVVCVGFRTYFKNAHVPGAVLHGPAITQQNLDELKKWAQEIPRSANLVVYCGCCPLSGCPNLRPGFLALRAMGFKRLRVLPVPNSFAVDWVEKGYPIEKGD